ncbi:MAG: PQQ-dependent sugar dehydrogenase [Alphaproteobacteria bacterium]
MTVASRCRRRWTTGFVALALAAGCGPAMGQGDATPGQRFEVRPSDMPPPFATESARNPPRSIRLPRGTAPRVPPGFKANLFAEDLDHARWLAVAPDGAVFLAQSKPGVVTILRDTDGDGVADLIRPFVTGLARPHGLAFHQGQLYVADTKAVRRYPYESALDGPAGPAETVTPGGALGSASGHWTRNIAFGPDGLRFFVAIGSAGNIDVEPEPRATVQMFDKDGGGQKTFASGLRNPVGIAFYPGTDDLYVVVNERDGMGDELVPDYLTRIEDGDFFGWPYAYIGDNPQPRLAELRPDLVAASRVPDVLFRSHSAPLGLVFYDGEQFPQEYRGDAFVALHGSWNAAEPRGYMVVRVPFEDQRPLGHYEAFATGFWAEGRDRARVWGRPVGLAVARDGSLLIADDVGDRIWRVSFEG